LPRIELGADELRLWPAQVRALVNGDAGGAFEELLSFHSVFHDGEVWLCLGASCGARVGASSSVFRSRQLGDEIGQHAERRVVRQPTATCFELDAGSASALEHFAAALTARP
jgi:hypothetical protein